MRTCSISNLFPRLVTLVVFASVGTTLARETGAQELGGAPTQPEEQSVLIAPPPEADTLVAPFVPRQSPRPDFGPPVPRISELGSLETLPLPSPVGTTPPRIELAPPSNRIGRSMPQLSVMPGQLVAAHVPLHRWIRVKDGQKIAPGAHPVVVSVRDPRACHEACACCTHRSVFVQVWVPPFPLQELKVKDNGRRIELDYGKYEIEIEVRKRGRIEVDYDD